MRTKLTKRTVEAARVGTADVFLWDTELTNFGVKVTPAGRRVFVAQYWAPHLTRVRRRVTLGTFGTVTVDQARAAAQRILGRVANGEDPAAETTARRTAKESTLAVVSAEYLEEIRAKMKTRTADEYDRLFRVYIVPAIGKKPIAHVALREIAALHLAHRAHPYQANRILQLLKTFLFWTETRGYRARGTNPCRDVEAFAEHARERFLTADEIGRLGVALVTAERDGLPPAPRMRKKAKTEKTAKHRPKGADTPIPANPFAVGAIRFLLFTGWREQEALTLRWSEVDLDRGAATLPDTKTGKSQRPLGAPAIELLTALPRVEGSAYVFPGAITGEPLKEIRRVWTAARHAAGLSDVRLHDLRHTVASFAVGSGHSLYLTGKLLGHARAETTQRYAHLADDARKAAADTVSSAIAAALGGKVIPVTPLKKQRTGGTTTRRA
jgi:integrase